MREQCDNCRFSINTDYANTAGNYLCRRFPPQNIHAVDAYEVGDCGVPKILARGCAVPVNNDWWCGEWRPKAGLN